MRNLSTVVCPDPSYKCDDGTTCCSLKSGGYGCCPYPNAVCCSDGVNCCPDGYSCDTTHQRCVSSFSSKISLEFENFATFKPVMKNLVPRKKSSFEKSSNMEISTLEGSDIMCPDKTSVCADGTTCCELNDGSYGCCPYANATCCADRQHCCPHGFVVQV